MVILNHKVSLKDLEHLEPETYFDDMMKCVVDIDKELIAVSAELHSDLVEYLLNNGSEQKYLYGINILYDDGEIEYDSLINPPRNRDAGYPRAGRYVADPDARNKIAEVVQKWIEI
jgi:hypothetical protein